MKHSCEFSPDWFSRTGETIQKVAEQKNISADKLAEALGVTDDQVNELFDGVLPVSKNMSEKLEQVLGVSSKFWMRREEQYRDALSAISTFEKGNKSAEIVAGLPVTELVKRNWIRGSQGNIASILKYFGVSNYESLEHIYADLMSRVSLRHSKACLSEVGALMCWLRRAELLSAASPCGPWEKKNFKDSLWEIRSLAKQKDPIHFVPKLTEICAASGVQVVVLRAPLGCKASGATLKCESGSPKIVMSARHLSDDHFWFTFFHEAGHAILHDQDRTFVDTDFSEAERVEAEANSFSSDILVPLEFRDGLRNAAKSEYEIARFARRVGVSAGIIVGQLQYHGYLSMKQFNGFKARYKWSGEELISASL